MANSKVWFAREASIKMALASAITISSTTALGVQFGSGTATAIAGIMKDITVTESVSEVDQIDLLGEDANGFQNVEGEEKPYGMVEVAGTMILPGDEVIETYIYDSSTTSVGYTRYRQGNGTRKRVALLIDLSDGTDEVAYAGTNGWLTAKEVKVTGADGHFEATGTFKFLPRDWYGPEFKD